MISKDADNYLLLSGIQHFVFCQRQWALIHIEQQWAENVKTLQGEIVHRNVDLPEFIENRKDKYVFRSMRVISHELEITGVCDLVEFLEDDEGVYIPSLGVKCQIIPIEYKRGKQKSDYSDELQLAAQTMCLEEMLVCHIEYGYIYYDEIKRRHLVEISDEIREEVIEKLTLMHQYYDRQYTPKVRTGKWCQSCSLQNVCLPRLMTKETVSEYLVRRLAE